MLLGALSQDEVYRTMGEGFDDISMSPATADSYWTIKMLKM
jgi:hypothetical protein